MDPTGPDGYTITSLDGLVERRAGIRPLDRPPTAPPPAVHRSRQQAWLRTTHDRKRASHHGIGGNLKRAGALVNGYVLMQLASAVEGLWGWWEWTKSVNSEQDSHSATAFGRISNVGGIGKPSCVVKV